MYYACDGLYTDTLHLLLGTGSFSTLLNRPVIRYTALGDSYSAGTGAGSSNYLFPAECRRTNTAYSRLVRRAAAGRAADRLPARPRVPRREDRRHLRPVRGSDQSAQ